MSMQGEASVYEGVRSGNEWDWSPVGDGLQELDVKDLEFPGNSWLVGGTDDGIWRIQPGNPSWERANADFAGIDITALDELGYQTEMWAASGVVDGYRRLYYSGTESSDPWNSYQEVQPEGVPFDKVVNDISAVYVFNDLDDEYQSVYVAAQDGLYLLDMNGTNSDAPVREYISFQENTQYFQNSPFRYDSHVVSVDYYQSSWTDLTRYVLVGTTYNIYLITETRSGTERTISEITIDEIVTGTYFEDHAALSAPEYIPYYYETVLTNSSEGLIKRWDSDSWEMRVSANHLDPQYSGTDIDAERVTHGNGSALAGFMVWGMPDTEG